MAVLTQATWRALVGALPDDSHEALRAGQARPVGLYHRPRGLTLRLDWRVLPVRRGVLQGGQGPQLPDERDVAAALRLIARARPLVRCRPAAAASPCMACYVCMRVPLTARE
jgi:hypothetical protein